MEALKKKKWDAIILEPELPGIKGMNLLNAAKKTNPEIKIIILTSFGTLEAAIAAIRLQVFDYLLKPVLPREILQTIDRAFREEQVGLRVGRAEKPNASKTLVPWEPIQLSSDLKYDPNKRQIISTSSAINLTQNENQIFSYLVQQKGSVISHVDLVEHAYGFTVGKVEAVKILRPLICRLKKKISAKNINSGIIQMSGGLDTCSILDNKLACNLVIIGSIFRGRQPGKDAMCSVLRGRSLVNRYKQQTE